jgi:hypothetical protein
MERRTHPRLAPLIVPDGYNYFRITYEPVPRATGGNFWLFHVSTARKLELAR